MLRANPSGFAADLRVSPRVPIVMLAVAGLALGAVAEQLGLMPRAAAVVLIVEALAALAWLLDSIRLPGGPWCAIAAWVAGVLLANQWLPAPGSLALLSLPTALAAAVIGLPAAAAITVTETGLIGALARYGTGGVGPAAAGVALVAIWATLGVMFAVYRPVYQLTGWSWQHFQDAQHLLEEARARRGELKQALEDLADANLQLIRLNALAQGLRQAAEEARVAKEQFVANVSHELRTPLNMIVGFSEMIMEAPASYGAIPPALLADLAVIQRNSQHLSSLIDDVLELSQIEAGRAALTRERVALSEIVEATVVAVRPLYETNRLFLETDVPGDLVLFCDRTRIREVLLNLLINAGRFTERGGVRVRAWQEGSDVIVAVADTGPGIAPEDLPRLFQPFRQLDGSIRRRYGGTGLGLAISKSFIELHGGQMWVESELGAGTTFSFRLSKEGLAPLEGGAARWLTPSWEHVQRTRRPLVAPPILRRRLVVLEHGQSLQRLLARHLDGVEVVPVASLEEAAQELARVPAQALLVNDNSSAEALERFGGVAALPEATPVIICSVPGPHEAAGTLGAADYLVKPISCEALLEALDRLHLSGRTVLIVDDEPDARRLFRRMLVSSGRGYRVLRAADGRHALSILREQHPDVLLLDLVMPGMDGFQLLAAKSADPSLRDIPTVVISARDPAGQPIVSNVLSVTRRDGLSMHQLLRCIEALSEVLSPAGQAGDRGPQAVPAD